MDRIATNPNREVEAEFAAWLKQSPLNVAEFLIMLSVDEAIAGMDGSIEVALAVKPRL